MRARARLLEPHAKLILGVVSANVAALTVAAILHHRYRFEWAFSELGLISSLDAAQLLVAGLLGLFTFRLFWQRASRPPSPDEAAGILLWGLLGAGLLVFAADDFFSVHERVGNWAIGSDRTILLTNNADDLITLSYGAAGLMVLAVFRHELFAMRASSSLLLVGVGLSGVMLATDSFARGPLTGIEFPSQVLAVAFLLLAQRVRLLEVRASRLAVSARRTG